MQLHENEQDKLSHIVDKHKSELACTLLCLVWRAGLKREEIVSLRWEQIDIRGRSLHLGGRKVLLDDTIIELLKNERSKRRSDSIYVAEFPDSGKPMSRATVSRYIKEILEENGIGYLTIADLRHDFVRRMLEADTETGLKGAGQFPHKERQTLVAEQTDDDTAEVLERVLHKNRTSPAGIALWLMLKANMDVSDISGLTWDQVDFENALIHLGNRDIIVSSDIVSILRDEKKRRALESDSHIILSKNAQKPMHRARLLQSAKYLLQKNWLPASLLGAQNMRGRMQNEREQILQYVRDKGSISVAEARDIIMSKQFTAYTRIGDLVEAGALQRNGRRYYLSEQVVPKAQQQDEVVRYLKEHGTATERQISEHLHISNAAAERLLRRMVASGKLSEIRRGRIYLLPKKMR